MTLTRFVMTVIVLFVAVYDIVIIALYGIDASVSRWVNDFLDAHGGQPATCVIVGVSYCCGHWFGFMNPRKTPAPGPLLYTEPEAEIRKLQDRVAWLSRWSGILGLCCFIEAAALLACGAFLWLTA